MPDQIKYFDATLPHRFGIIRFHVNESRFAMTRLTFVVDEDGSFKGLEIIRLM